MVARSGIETAVLSMLAPMLARIGSDPNVQSTIDNIVREWRDMRASIARIELALGHAAADGTGSAVRPIGYGGNGSEVAAPIAGGGEHLS